MQSQTHSCLSDSGLASISLFKDVFTFVNSDWFIELKSCNRYPDI